MAVLAVNIGNTNIRAAIGRDRPEAGIILPTGEAFDAKAFADAAEQRFGAGFWARIEESIICSVVPAQTASVEEIIRCKTVKPSRRIDIHKCGDLDIRHYSGLIGEDRVVCCAGALMKYAPPFIVTDFGTATTINVVNGNKELLGGAILAGVQIGLNALSGNTAQLPRVEASSGIPLIGRNTRENLLSGAVVGTACAVEEYARRIRHELGSPLSVIVTGGHAPMVLPYCGFSYAHEPDLLLNSLFALNQPA